MIAESQKGLSLSPSVVKFKILEEYSKRIRIPSSSVPHMAPATPTTDDSHKQLLDQLDLILKKLPISH